MKSTVEQIKKTVKKEFEITNNRVQKCVICGGIGISNGKPCTHCQGIGYVYIPREKNLTIGRSTGETTRKPTVEETIAKITADVINKDTVTFKEFKHNETVYLLSKELLVTKSMSKNLIAKGELKEDCLNKLLKIFYEKYKVKSLEELLKVIKTVQGVRYKAEYNTKCMSLSGKPTGENRYVKSRLKLSNKVWINSATLQFFNNHRFAYINQDTPAPVLCINKTTGTLDGMVMPLVEAK